MKAISTISIISHTVGLTNALDDYPGLVLAHLPSESLYK